MNKQPAFLFYASDWLGSTRRALMTPAQRGAYIDLLCHQWSDPTCSLPDDDEALAALSGLGEGWFNGGSRLVRDCFPPHPTLEGRVANPRLLEVRRERDEWIDKSRRGGRKSAETRRARKAVAAGTSGDGANQGPTKAQPNVNQGPNQTSTKAQPPYEPNVNQHPNQSSTKAPTKAQPTPQPNVNTPSPFPSPHVGDIPPLSPKGETGGGCPPKPDRPKPAGTRPPKFDPRTVPIPANLQTSEFAAAWEEWIKYRAERKPALTPTAAKRQLATLSQWGVRRAVAAIEWTIFKQWQGLAEPGDRGAPLFAGERRDPSDPRGTQAAIRQYLNRRTA